MARAPFQVLVLPWRRAAPRVFEFAVFRRSDSAHWQGIAGGGEDDETPLDTARRETHEESGISPASAFLPLDTMASIPVTEFRDSALWGDDRYVITEFAFGVDAGDQPITLSDEHEAFRWMPYDEARRVLMFDSNRTALWELYRRLLGRGPRDWPHGPP